MWFHPQNTFSQYVEYEKSTTYFKGLKELLQVKTDCKIIKLLKPLESKEELKDMFLKNFLLLKGKYIKNKKKRSKEDV